MTVTWAIGTVVAAVGVLCALLGLILGQFWKLIGILKPIQAEQAAARQDAMHAEVVARDWKREVTEAVGEFRRMLTEFTSKVAVIEAQWDTMHRLVGQVQEHAQRIAAIEARCESNTEWSQRTEVPIDSDGVVAEPVGVGCPVKGRRDR